MCKKMTNNAIIYAKYKTKSLALNFFFLGIIFFSNLFKLQSYVLIFYYQATKGESSAGILPQSFWFNVFERLSYEDILNVENANTQFENLVKLDKMWKVMLCELGYFCKFMIIKVFLVLLVFFVAFCFFL